MLRVAVLAVGTLALLAGCGGSSRSDTSTQTTTTATSTTPVQTTALRVYFLRGGQVWPVAREVGSSPAVGTAALDALLAGPSTQESDQLALSTAIPDGTTVKSLAIASGIATLELSTDLATEPLAQVVYTLTQFPAVRSVEVGGKRYRRADFEPQTPPIFVESPLSYATVTSPLRVRGTANTFEATFQYELRDADGKIVSKHFEMATSGSGTRGTFDFTVPFTVARAGPGKLTLYEDSAENGSHIHQQEIPLRLGP